MYMFMGAWLPHSGTDRNQKRVTRKDAAMHEFYADDMECFVFLHEVCSRKELLECEPCQVT
jgi:hypothetical protein